MKDEQQRGEAGKKDTVRWDGSGLQDMRGLQFPAAYGLVAERGGWFPVCLRRYKNIFRTRKDSGSLPSGKHSNRPNNRNRHDKGGNIFTDAPASFTSLQILPPNNTVRHPPISFPAPHDTCRVLTGFHNKHIFEQYSPLSWCLFRRPTQILPY